MSKLPDLVTVQKQQTAADVRDVLDVLRSIVHDENGGRLRVSRETMARVRASLLILGRAERNTRHWLP